MARLVHRGFARGQVLYYGLEVPHEVQFTIVKKDQTLRVVTARVLLRPQWFFYVPPMRRVDSVERRDLRLNVLIREDAKV